MAFINAPGPALTYLPQTIKPEDFQVVFSNATAEDVDLAKKKFVRVRREQIKQMAAFETKNNSAYAGATRLQGVDSLDEDSILVNLCSQCQHQGYWSCSHSEEASFSHYGVHQRSWARAYLPFTDDQAGGLSSCVFKCYCRRRGPRQEEVRSRAKRAETVHLVNCLAHSHTAKLLKIDQRSLMF